MIAVWCSNHTATPHSMSTAASQMPGSH